MYLGSLLTRYEGTETYADRLMRRSGMTNPLVRPPVKVPVLPPPETAVSTVAPAQTVQTLPAVETTSTPPAPVRAEVIPVTQSSNISPSSGGGGGSSIIELPGSGAAAPIEDAPSNTAVDTPVAASMSNWLMLSLLGGALFMAVKGKKSSRRKRAKRSR